MAWNTWILKIVGWKLEAGLLQWWKCHIFASKLSPSQVISKEGISGPFCFRPFYDLDPLTTVAFQAFWHTVNHLLILSLQNCGHGEILSATSNKKKRMSHMSFNCRGSKKTNYIIQVCPPGNGLHSPPNGKRTSIDSKVPEKRGMGYVIVPWRVVQPGLNRKWGYNFGTS